MGITVSKQGDAPELEVNAGRKSALETIANDYMKKVTADRYGVDLNDEIAEDVPQSESGHNSPKVANTPVLKHRAAVQSPQAQQIVAVSDSPKPANQSSSPSTPLAVSTGDDDDDSSVDSRDAIPPMQQSASLRTMRWQRGGLIGSGAFGKVFLGLNLDTGELLAIKQVPLMGNPSEREKEIATFEQEVALMNGLAHENIVQYLGVSLEDSHLNIFLEYVPGGSISSLLAKFGAFSESVIRVYTRQILSGLAYLHSHRIVHRDIKGANILVDNLGTVKLADFGASKRLQGLCAGTVGQHSLKGTPYYMAPEVIKQTGHGRSADIWSVGCTVYEMFTGKPPWSEIQDQVSALFKIASSDAIPQLPQALTPEAADFFRLCFQRDPRQRPSAARLLDHTFVLPRPGAPSPIRPRAGSAAGVPQPVSATSTPTAAGSLQGQQPQWEEQPSPKRKPAATPAAVVSPAVRPREPRSVSKIHVESRSRSASSPTSPVSVRHKPFDASSSVNLVEEPTWAWSEEQQAQAKPARLSDPPRRPPSRKRSPERVTSARRRESASNVTVSVKARSPQGSPRLPSAHAPAHAPVHATSTPTTAPSHAPAPASEGQGQPAAPAAGSSASGEAADETTIVKFVRTLAHSSTRRLVTEGPLLQSVKDFTVLKEKRFDDEEIIEALAERAERPRPKTPYQPAHDWQHDFELELEHSKARHTRPLN